MRLEPATLDLEFNTESQRSNQKYKESKNVKFDTYINGPVHHILEVNTSASNEESEQPVISRSLAIAFVDLIHNILTDKINATSKFKVILYKCVYINVYTSGN